MVGEHLHSATIGKKSIKGVGKPLSIRGIQRRRATGMNTTAAQRFHKVAHLQSTADVLAGMDFATGCDRNGALLEHLSSQRDIGGDDKIARHNLSDNFVVGHIETGLDLNRINERRRRLADRLIGHQRQSRANPLRGPEQDLPDHDRTGVCIDPEMRFVRRLSDHGEKLSRPAHMIRAGCRIFIDAVRLWLAQNAFGNAGALAFYTLFSLAPVMILVIAVAGVVLGPDAAEGRIVAQLEAGIGPEAARAIQQTVAGTRLESAGWLPTLAGVAAMVIGATAVFAQLQRSLNAIWGVTAQPSRSSLLIIARNRLLSLLIALVFGLIMLASLLATIALQAVIRFAEQWLPFDAAIMTGMESLVSLALITALFALIFRILPDVVLSWRDVVPGAAITAVLFMLGRYLMASYLTIAAPASAYGAAGSLVLVLLWIYGTSLILLFGAALTRSMLTAR